jgi:hypothetical protein
MACQERKTLETAQDAQLDHPNGLQLSRPPGFQDIQTEHGFTLSESGDIRTPRKIEIELVNDQPVMQQPRQRALPAGAVARFSIREVGVGSAGPEYELRASEEVGDRWIVVIASAQSERGEPDFALAWQVLESARLSRVE